MSLPSQQYVSGPAAVVSCVCECRLVVSITTKFIRQIIDMPRSEAAVFNPQQLLGQLSHHCTFNTYYCNVTHLITTTGSNDETFKIKTI